MLETQVRGGGRTAGGKAGVPPQPPAAVLRRGTARGSPGFGRPTGPCLSGRGRRVLLCRRGLCPPGRGASRGHGNLAPKVYQSTVLTAHPMCYCPSLPIPGVCASCIVCIYVRLSVCVVCVCVCDCVCMRRCMCCVRVCVLHTHACVSVCVSICMSVCWLLCRNLQEGAGRRHGVPARVGGGKDGEESRGLCGPWQGLVLPITLFGFGEKETMETSWAGCRHKACGWSFGK